MHVKKWSEQTTTDALATLNGDWTCGEFKEKAIVVRNTGGSNSLTYRILGSTDDGATFLEEVAEVAVAFGASSRQEINGPFTDLRIEIRATVGSNQTTAEAEGAGFEA